MKPYQPTTYLLNPKFQVIATWIWNGIAAFLVMGIVTVMLPSNVVVNREVMQQQPKLALIPIIAEIVAVGLLPIVFTLISKDKAAWYGLSREGLVKSLVLSALIVAAYFAVLSLRAGQFTTGITVTDVHINTPWNLLFAITGAAPRRQTPVLLFAGIFPLGSAWHRLTWYPPGVTGRFGCFKIVSPARLPR
jgi:hypothetical protein